MDQLDGVRRRLQAAADLSQYFFTWDLMLVGVVTIGVAVLIYGTQRRIGNLPPGPRNWPVIGAFLEMEPTFHKSMEKFARKYGPVVFFRLGIQKIVLVSSAKAAEELLKQKDGYFADRACPMTRSASRYACFDGMVMPMANYDAELKMYRKISFMKFFTTARIKSYENLRRRETAVMVEKIFSAIHSSSGEANNANGPPAMDIRLIGTGVMQNIVFSLCIGKDFDCLAPTDELREFPGILDDLVELIMSFNLADYFPWLTWFDPQGLMKTLKSFDKRQTRFYETILARSRQETKSKLQSKIMSNEVDEGTARCFVNVLLRQQETGPEQITDKGIMATVLSMMAGGVDTTSTQFAWVVVQLVRHPKVLQRLQHEVDSVVGKERPLEEADLQAMPFLNAVILETLRLNPILPITFPHVNMEPSTLCGYSIPARTAVLVNSSAIGRDPKRWKDPLKFDPDRFMVHNTINASGSCYDLLPFGSGRRACPGYILAIVMLTRTVGTVVHAFDWSPPPGCSPEDLGTRAEGAFVLHPLPRHVVPTPRLSPLVYKSSNTVLV